MTGTRTRPAGLPFHVADEEGVVTVQKVFTPAGERLVLTAGGSGESIRLDAMALESVAWQDPAEMRERAADLDWTGGGGRGSGPPESEPEPDERTEPITVSNEFAQATLVKVDAGDRQLLEVSAPKLGYSIRLAPRELAWLTRQDHGTFTEWLETPFGPAAEEHDH